MEKEKGGAPGEERQANVVGVALVHLRQRGSEQLVDLAQHAVVVELDLRRRGGGGGGVREAQRSAARAGRDCAPAPPSWTLCGTPSSPGQPCPWPAWRVGTEPARPGGLRGRREDAFLPSAHGAALGGRRALTFSTSKNWCSSASLHLQYTRFFRWAASSSARPPAAPSPPDGACAAGQGCSRAAARHGRRTSSALSPERGGSSIRALRRCAADGGVTVRGQEGVLPREGVPSRERVRAGKAPP